MNIFLLFLILIDGGLIAIYLLYRKKKINWFLKTLFLLISLFFLSYSGLILYTFYYIISEKGLL